MSKVKPQDEWGKQVLIDHNQEYATALRTLLHYYQTARMEESIPCTLCDLTMIPHGEPAKLGCAACPWKIFQGRTCETAAMEFRDRLPKVPEQVYSRISTCNGMKVYSRAWRAMRVKQITAWLRCITELGNVVKK